MIDNKKEQEREELHRTIWNMANDLRGSVDGWDFKQYVLGMGRGQNIFRDNLIALEMKKSTGRQRDKDGMNKDITINSISG